MLRKKHNVILLLVSLFFASTLKSNAASVNVQSLSPPYNLVYEVLESALSDPTERFHENQRPVWFLGLHYNFVKSPLVELNEARDQRKSIIVDHINTFDLAGGFWILPWLSIYAQAPLHIVKLPARDEVFAMGDLRLNLKAQLNDSKDPVVFSLIPELRLPTGDQKTFISDSSVSAGAMLAAEMRIDRWSLVANAGFRYSSDARFSNLDQTQRVPLGVGASFQLAPKWSLNAEFMSAIPVPDNQYANVNELFGAVNFHPEQHYAFFGGISTGNFDKAAAVDVRLQLGFRMIGILEKDMPPPVQEPMPVAAIEPAPEAPLPPVETVVRLTTTQIEVLEEIKFSHDSSVLTERSRDILDEVARVIKNNRKYLKKIEIQGHCNKIGSHAYNDGLSDRRSHSVLNYLIRKGIPKGMLIAKGYGKRVPKKLPKNASEARHLMEDRRVEFHIIESTSETKEKKSAPPSPEAPESPEDFPPPPIGG